MIGRRPPSGSIAGIRALFGLANRAAANGAQLLKAQGPGGRLVRSRGRRDVKIAADAALDDAIVGFLRRASRFPILTEESGDIRRAYDHGGHRWIVDPLDGSFNHSRKIPLCAVSVALWRGDTPVLGVVHDPMRGEVFSGIVGVGAWLNGRPMTTSAVAERRRAVLCTGFPVASDFSAAALRSFVRSVRAFAKVRLLGSAALSLAYVAAGRADAYVEREIKLWDVAAGLAILRAAGGSFSAEHGRQRLTRVVVATNGRLRL